MELAELKEKIFSIENKQDFERLAFEVFHFQYENSPVYRKFCDALGKKPSQITEIINIPFLPIEFFKSHKILSKQAQTEEIFTSSGTTGNQVSKHYVSDLKIYETAFVKAFEEKYGKLTDYVVLALLPSYLERTGSSLIYMVNAFMEKSNHPRNGFYLDDLKSLSLTLKELDKEGKKILLIGVSFALLDLIEKEKFQLKNTIVMETGGMKGRKKEITRQELHQHLKKGFGVKNIHSEYGMTELLSQAYSNENGVFSCPKWMKVFIREPHDPFEFLPFGKSGGINIIDLANINSCSFIATQDLGRIYENGKFEVIGRFDHSDIRGCNLMAL